MDNGVKKSHAKKALKLDDKHVCMMFFSLPCKKKGCINYLESEHTWIEHNGFGRH